MLEGHSIVYFGPERWEGMWRNRHQLMSRFALKNKVIYVEPVFSANKLREYLRHGFSGLRDLWKEVGQTPRLSKAADNLYVYHSPVYAFVFGRSPLIEISWWIWNLLFKLSLKKLGFSRPIIWLTRPNMSYFMGNFNEKLVIYHVVDEYSAYGKLDTESREKAKILEQKILKRADLVIVVSENLHANKSAFNKHTYIVPNGVDYAAYNKAMTDDAPAPSDILQLPKPVIGYSGLISRRLDLGLIDYIAKVQPEWTLVLIGEVNESGCESEFSRLREMKNIYFLGNKKIDLVPHYVKVFDVCIVPYKQRNEQTQNLSPLKLYDFMAMGKGIVTTDFPIAREFQSILHIAESKETFVNCIVKALSEKDKRLFAKRRQIAAQNTWENRIVELSNIIESHL